MEYIGDIKRKLIDKYHEKIDVYYSPVIGKYNIQYFDGDIAHLISTVNVDNNEMKYDINYINFKIYGSGGYKAIVQASSNKEGPIFVSVSMKFDEDLYSFIVKLVERFKLLLDRVESINNEIRKYVSIKLISAND